MTSFIEPKDDLRKRAEMDVLGTHANKAFSGDLKAAELFYRHPARAARWATEVALRIKELSGEAAVITAANTPQPRKLPKGVAGDGGWTYSARLGFLSPSGTSVSEKQAALLGADVATLKARAGARS